MGNLTELEDVIRTVANEMHLELEIIPISEFIPIPDGAHLRHRFLEHIGSISLYAFDPYTIAVSKLARGFEADLQDVLFMLRNNIIDLDQLEEFVEQTILVAWDYDIDPKEMRGYFAEVKKQLSIDIS